VRHYINIKNGAKVVVSLLKDNYLHHYLWSFVQVSEVV